jgi:EAL domain-containing protein (putative c-di-GMP-specific phosphodiesterase class I)/GGDEF domain-containing protein/PAS domain-containing protein
VVISFVHLLGLTGLPDGRFSIVLISVSFFGPLAGILTASSVLIASSIFNYYEVSLLIGYLLLNYCAGFFIYKIKNKSQTMHILVNMVVSFMLIALISFLGRFLVHKAYDQLKVFQFYLYVVLCLNCIFTFAISFVLSRENNRSYTIKEQKQKHRELTKMNNDILSLNQQLVEADKKYRLVLKASNEGFIDYNHETKLLYLSERAMEICDNLLKSHRSTLEEAFNIIEENDALKIKALFLELKQNVNSGLAVQLKVKQRNDIYKYVRFNGILTREEGQITGLVGSLVDISEQVEKEEVINRLAYLDEITGLLNENAFIRDMTLEIENEKAGSLLFLSLVGYLNLEIMGQAYQNLVRMHLSNRLKKVFRKFSTYQLSDGCYCVILPEDLQEMKITDYFERLKVELEVPFHLKDVYIPVQITSIYFKYPLRLIEAEGFLSRAKSSLIQLQKNNEHDLTLFDEEKHSKLVRSNRIENHIIRSLEKNEFYVVFQPQIHKKEKKIIGYEALLRWESENFGSVTPSEFIPIAESNGTIITIGRFVLEKVCDFIQAMEKKEPINFSVSINVSFLELVNPIFAVNFNEYVVSRNLSPNYIAIEVTETAMVEYIEIILVNLRILRALGYEVHLDDFGTGYSSLNHITMIKIDCLKIDKSFIDKITIDETTLRVVESLINLSHNIGVKVFAEGVETEEQIDVLERLQCDYFQGYYYSKPLKVDTILNENFIHL